jgi:hypothetical protein
MSTDERVIHRFFTEKRAGFGEDAEPLARYVSGVGDVTGVFDGMGGSGSILVPEENEKDLCTMARLASRFAKRAAAGVVNQWGKDDLSKLKSELETRITKSLLQLAERKGGKGPEGNKLRGTILSLYPTTVALAVVRRTKDEFEDRQVKALWAGDSRVYALDFSQLIPLQVLTRDHTQSGDGGDGALARYASADGLELEESDFVLPSGAAVIAMTDGCYGYMSPFRLLYTLVKHMVRSRDAEDWILRIKDDISTAAGDDTSFAISFGKGGFAALRQEAEKLLEYLEPLAHLRETSPANPFIVPFDESAYLELREEHKRRQELAAAHEKVSTPVMSSAPEASRGEPGSPVPSPAEHAPTEVSSLSRANPGTEKSGDLPPSSSVTG